MTDALPVELTALAAQQIREAETWWRRNRTAAPNAIREELERALALIASHPNAGGRADHVKLPNVRRVFMPRIKYHVYYHVLAAPPRIQVVAFWHARRGEGPPV
jgi:plasmid stabilization system protein ParE